MRSAVAKEQNAGKPICGNATRIFIPTRKNLEAGQRFHTPIFVGDAVVSRFTEWSRSIGVS